MWQVYCGVVYYVILHRPNVSLLNFLCQILGALVVPLFKYDFINSTFSKITRSLLLWIEVIHYLMVFLDMWSVYKMLSFCLISNLNLIGG
jgi:hypothetical protein